MSDVNIVILTGRLTVDPVNRTTPSGVSVCDIRFASNRRSADGKQFTTYIQVTLWNKVAEWAGENLRTGDEIHVMGQLFDNNFEKDGQKTSGRLKVDNARIKLLRKAKPKDSPAQGEEPVEIPEV